MMKRTAPPRRDLRTPLRRALEDGDHLGVHIAILNQCEVDTATSCWEWPRLRKGYPFVVVNGKELQVHRLSLEARLRKPLGKQAAHHRCANSKCVNPDHLQPVTAAANMAEMLARRYYVSRIQDLEAALRAIDPEHPLLTEAAVR